MKTIIHRPKFPDSLSPFFTSMIICARKIPEARKRSSEAKNRYDDVSINLLHFRYEYAIPNATARIAETSSDTSPTIPYPKDSPKWLTPWTINVVPSNAVR